MIKAEITSIDVSQPGEVSENSGPQIPPFLILGAVTMNIPWFLKSGKVNKMKEAIDYYNLG